LSATREQRERLYHRYRFALDFVAGGRVFEVACGSGMGLTFLADRASLVIGGDIDPANLRLAVSRNVDPKIALNRMDAHHLPFRGRVFDVLVLFESLYYLESPETFIRESARVLRETGCLIIGTVNKDWPDFHPSPFAHRYFSVPELDALLRRHFADVRIYGAFRRNVRASRTHCSPE
jgi:ubiquinone/menaquinone biosynthesis C-methylase UbiE